MRIKPLLSIVAPVLLTGAAFFLGCDKKDPIQVDQRPKEPIPLPVLASKTAAPAGNAPAANAPADEGEPHWTVPATWKPGPEVRMASATFETADGLVITVTPLGKGGGALAPNVNRWQGQLGLPPSPEAELGKVATPVTVDGHQAHIVDLLGPVVEGKPQLRLLGGIVPAGESVYFLKLLGAADKVAAHKEEFAGWVKSFTFHADAVAAKPDATKPDQPAPAVPDKTNPPAAGDGKIPGVASYTLPAGWQVDATPKPMRAATIIVTKNGAQAEIIVSRMGAGAFGDKTANLTRWRAQVGLPPPDDDKGNPAVAVTLAQGPADLLDFVGPEAEGNARKRELVAMTRFEKQPLTWFFRFNGPYELVTASKPEFEAFVKSLKFEE